MNTKMISKKVDVLVLGAGVVGLSVAHQLQSAGRSVTVIDKGQAGYGCSYGNAGWITPCFAMPLPQPGMFWKSLGWLLNPESPLYIKPEAKFLLLKWLLHFSASMTTKKMNQSIEVLTEISKDSLKFYSELAKRVPGTFGYDQKGLLMVSGTKEGFSAAIQEMDLMAARGIEGRKLTQKDILEMEPSLKNTIQGGVYFPTEAHAEPLQVVQAIAKEFVDCGGLIQPFTEVYDFEFEGSKIKKVMTTKGIFEPDLVVLAMGSWSKVLAKKLEMSIPILGGKGYSLIVENFSVKPKHPIMIVERKIAITPRAQSVRVAGTLELVDQDDSITRRRVDAIIKGTQEFFHFNVDTEKNKLNANNLEAPRISEVWRGLRPCTPDGVPMIGFSKNWSNLFFCTGHQMLGLQSAPGSGRLAKELIMNQTTFVNPKPFDPNRF